MQADPYLDASVAIRFGDQLVRQRTALGLTQEQLAEAVGISRVQLQNIEGGLADRAGRRVLNPRLETLAGLCRALGGTIRIDFVHPAGVEIRFEAVAASP